MSRISQMLPRHFGPYGGRYVPEMLVPALEELEQGYGQCKQDPQFQAQLTDLYHNYCGRPTPLYFADKLTKALGGCKIYLKLEGLAHTGAHKINNALGQALLAQHLGKTRISAETGAGQHGLASATAAARFGLQCTVFMGEVDMRRQYPNVYAMKLLGAEVIPVTDGTKTLKDAVNATLKYWIQHLEDTHYILGSALGPFPFPVIVRDFQSIIGREVRTQILEREKRLPNHLVACVGGGSNAIGLFHPFLNEPGIRFHGAEAGGRGPKIGDHAARFTNTPKVGIAQGYKSYFLQNDHGQLQDTHSVSAGLDYAGVGPELAWLYDQQLVEFSAITDVQALEAFTILTRLEGIIPALESAHAVARAMELAPTLPQDEIMVVNISGRGDKDIFITARELDRNNWMAFLKREVEDDQ